MKYPSLSRVLAIVMAILSLALIGVGVAGIRDAQNDKQTDERKAELMEQRLSTYTEYKDILKDKKKYADALEEYEKLKEEYDDDHAEHKTDLAMYTATEGGIAQAKEQLPVSEAEVRIALDELNAKKTDFYNYGATYQSTIETARNSARAQMGGYTYPEVKANYDAIVAGISQIEQAEAQLNSLLNGMSVDQFRTDLEANIETAKTGYATAAEAYESANAAYLAAMEGYNADPPTVTKDQLKEAETAKYTAYSAMTSAETTKATLEAQLTSFNQLAAGVEAGNQKKPELEATRVQLDAQLPILQAADNQIISAACQAFYNQIASAEKQLYDAYALICETSGMITYKEWGLPKEQEELIERKLDLDKRAKELAAMKEENDKLKAEEKRFTSARILLESNQQIKASLDTGTELENATQNEITRFKNEIDKTYKCRIIICSMLLAAALFGILELFPAFEKIKSRFLRILFPILFVLLCAGAEALSVYIGRGNMYSAITSAVIGLICLLFIAPNAKKHPAIIEEINQEKAAETI